MYSLLVPSITSSHITSGEGVPRPFLLPSPSLVNTSFPGALPSYPYPFDLQYFILPYKYLLTFPLRLNSSLSTLPLSHCLLSPLLSLPPSYSSPRSHLRLSLFLIPSLLHCSLYLLYPHLLLHLLLLIFIILHLLFHLYSSPGEGTPAFFFSFLTVPVPSSFSSSLSSSSFIFFFSCYSKFSILYFFLFHFLLHPPFPD